jgi:phage terminase large subunit-like protein
VEGESGLLSVHPKDFRPVYEPSKRRLTWPNGAVASVYNATEPDQLRGPQHDAAWMDELAKWKYCQETYDQVQFGLRLGMDPKQLITTTPRGIPTLIEIMNEEGTRVTYGNTMDNVSNLAPKFLRKILGKYQGTRLGRQELNAEILLDVPGALWNLDAIDKCRGDRTPQMKRVVVSIDPSGTDGKAESKAKKSVSNETPNSVGIIVAGLGVDDCGHILADLTVDASPAEWGRIAVQAYKDYAADRIIGESNFGGAMVEFVIRTADKDVPYKNVKASRGKTLRAEPVAALYEQGRIKHYGDLSALEDQMCLMSPTGFLGKGSPDRVDAMVWAITELMLGDNTYTHEDLRRALADGSTAVPFQP